MKTKSRDVRVTDELVKPGTSAQSVHLAGSLWTGWRETQDIAVTGAGPDGLIGTGLDGEIIAFVQR